MMTQHAGTAGRMGDSADGGAGRPLKVLSLLFLVLTSINLTGLSILALSRSRFEEIQVGIVANQRYLMDSWIAEYLMRPTAIALFFVLFLVLVVKERLVSEAISRLVMNTGGWILSGALFFLLLDGLYGF